MRTAEFARDEGMAQAAARVGDGKLNHLFQALVDYLGRHSELFCDDFFSETNISRDRAFGVVVKQAARARLIEKTGEYRPSIASRLGPKPVWRSLLFNGRAG